MEKINGKILVTGSEGRIGKVVMADLANYSDNLVGVDIKNGIDLSNLQETEKFFESLGEIDSIVHLAANPNAGADWDNILKNNIMTTRNIYECARKYKVRRIVYASSSHTQGAYEGYPSHSEKGILKITDPVRPDGYYGLSKVFGEAIARQFYDLYKIESLCLRFGYVTPDNKPVKGYERHWFSDRDVAQAIRKALVSKIPYGIYYVTSEISDPMFDIEPAKKDLDFKPEDSLEI